ncbi:unnamed protein product [Linum trigynum]|uniref:TF-B3 domain-containing protein n=1 Tax=Linum trigynum TaxID=586398 RepID=A0AAV2DLC3_9ROSI
MNENRSSEGELPGSGKHFQEGASLGGDLRALFESGRCVPCILLVSTNVCSTSNAVLSNAGLRLEVGWEVKRVRRYAGSRVLGLGHVWMKFVNGAMLDFDEGRQCYAVTGFILGRDSCYAVPLLGRGL